jgi:hypothetical protein
MKLFILFAQFPNQPYPAPMGVIDENTIKMSGRPEDVYKKLALDTIKDQTKEEAQSWGWFELLLPPDAPTRISQALLQELPKFVTELKSSPTQKNHPSFNGITVTVGRNPQKIKDDEIFD